MVYAYVLLGSLLVIFAVLSGSNLIKHRSVRKFVRSVRDRVKRAEERKNSSHEEVFVCRQVNEGACRVTSIQLQKARSFIHEAERSLARGKTEEAERLFIQAITSNPMAHDARAQLAKLYLTLGKDQKAEAMYKELLAYCDDTSCFSNLGLAYYKQGKFEQSCDAYHKALERDSANPNRQAALGRALFAGQRFSEASEYLEKASASMGRAGALLECVDDSFVKFGNQEKAAEAYRKLNRIEPYNEKVKERLEALA